MTEDIGLVGENAPVAQLDRASDYESEGRTFESFRARHFTSHYIFVCIGHGRPHHPAARLVDLGRDRWRDTRHRIPQQSGSTGRFLAGAFLLFWLGGWAFGFHSAMTQVLSGKAGAFLIFWLGAWTVGGVFVVSMLYRIFRPAVSETLKLGTDGVTHDPGIRFRTTPTPRNAKMLGSPYSRSGPS
jgi:hypothetical protein